MVKAAAACFEATIERGAREDIRDRRALEIAQQQGWIELLDHEPHERTPNEGCKQP